MQHVLVSRYIIKEVMLATLAILLVLLLIGLANAFVGYLADAARGVISLRLVMYVLWLNVPILLSFLLPLAFFFGILLGLGRLYADSEMTALLASGYGPGDLLRTLLLPSFFVMLFTGLLNFYWTPHYTHELTRTLAQAEQDLLSRIVMPGRFQATDDGQHVIYIQDFDEQSRQAHGVFIAEQGVNLSDPTNVVTSETAHQWEDTQRGASYIVLEDGQRYQGVPGAADYQLMQFDQYGVRLVQRDADYRVRERVLSTPELWGMHTPKAQAELQWRFSLTFSVLIMAMLAMLLARLKPRQGKYANALPAILVAIIYTNCLILAKGWVADGKLTGLGVYWVPLLGLLIATFWQAQRTQWLDWKKLLP